MRNECSEECSGACLYGLKSVLNTLGKKWALLVITTLGNHQRLRYNDLMKNIQGISPKTLSDLLKVLEKGKLITRESFNEIPPRVEYSLTPDGKELRRAIIPLLEWISKRYRQSDTACQEIYL